MCCERQLWIEPDDELLGRSRLNSESLFSKVDQRVSCCPEGLSTSVEDADFTLVDLEFALLSDLHRKSFKSSYPNSKPMSSTDEIAWSIECLSSSHWSMALTERMKSTDDVAMLAVGQPEFRGSRPFVRQSPMWPADSKRMSPRSSRNHRQCRYNSREQFPFVRPVEPPLTTSSSAKTVITLLAPGLFGFCDQLRNCAFYASPLSPSPALGGRPAFSRQKRLSRSRLLFQPLTVCLWHSSSCEGGVTPLCTLGRGIGYRLGPTATAL